MIYIGKQLLGSPSSLKLLHTFGKSEVKVIQSRLTLCNPMDCSPPGSSVRGNLQARNTGVGSHSLLQGIFLTQRLNLGLLHCRQMLYHLSHQGSRPTNILTAVARVTCDLPARPSPLPPSLIFLKNLSFHIT